MLQDYVALRLTVYLGDSIGYYPCCSTCISLLLSPSPCWICICFVQFHTMHRPIFVPVCERVQVPRVCTMASGTSNKCDERMTEASRDSFKFSSNLSLEEIRALQERFAAERDWEKYHTPRNLMLAMVGEVGELAEIFQWRGEVGVGLPGWSEADQEHLGQELSDVLIYLIRLADRCHVDLPAAVLSKLSLNAKKYPASKVYGSSQKYTAYSDSSQSN